MRPTTLAAVLLSAFCLQAPGATAAPLAETLAGDWSCSVQETTAEGTRDIAMTLAYRRSDAFLVGEIVEDNGAVLLDVWLDGWRDGGAAALALRRMISYDATIEMQVAGETADSLRLEGEMRHSLGSTARVREEIRFAGADEFRAVWEADNGDGWELIMDRRCERL
ncbi:MAG: hypothetical protein ACFCUW_17490 [Kiloniellaceae bacterium]